MPQPSWYDPRPHPPGGAVPDPYPDRLGYETGTRRQARTPRPAPARLPWSPGTRPGRFGVSLVAGSAALGALATVLSGSDPGYLLGGFLLAGTAAAVLAVRPRVTYLIIPVPAPAYAVAAVIAGLIRDRAASTSMVAVSAAQWMASGFVEMTAATMLVIAVIAARWLALRRSLRYSGRRPLAASPVAPGPGGLRRARDDWGTSAPGRRGGA